MNESQIFLAASQIEDTKLRESFLDSVCRDQPDLRQRVDNLLKRFAVWEDAVDQFPDALPEKLAAIRQESSALHPSTTSPSSGPSPSVLPIGQELHQYRIEKCLGVGGMGEVYQATDGRLKRQVAIKFLPQQRTADQNWIKRFTVEAQSASSLNHPNILTVFEIGDWNGHPFMVTELVDGQTLRQTFEHQSLTPSSLLQYAIGVGRALQAAHDSGIIHRDLKPDNVMVRRDGLIKVLDFGLAKQLDTTKSSDSTKVINSRTPITDPQMMLGTVRYMSPEQVRRQSLDYRSDMFSFGIMLYEMFTGNLPFTGPTDADVISKILQSEPAPIIKDSVPEELQRLIRTLLRKDRDKRLLSAQEAVIELELIAEKIGSQKTSGVRSEGIRQTLTDVAYKDDTAPIEMDIPEVRYTRSGEVNIAYQVLGRGDIDIVFVMGWVSHLDWFWKDPAFANFLRRLATFSRLILFDKRGTGLSDRVPSDQLPTLEQRMDDVRAVMEAVGSDRAVLCGVSEGGPMSSLFAATYPEKTTALIMIGCYARRLRADDYPWGPTPQQHAVFLEDIRQNWGGPVGIETRAPSKANDSAFRQWWATYLRMGASPGAVLALTRMNAQIDVRPVLKAIQVPTLIIHRTGDQCLKVEEGRYLAENIPGAKFVELSGNDHLPFVGHQNEILEPIEEFLTGVSHNSKIKRVLATVLFGQYSQTELTPADRASSNHDPVHTAYAHAVREVDLFRGKSQPVSQAQGPVVLLATFDGPARAVRAAMAMRASARRLGVAARFAVHTGECELQETHISGPAVEAASWVIRRTPVGSIVVSGTVKDLVAGSELQFKTFDENTTDNNMPRHLYLAE